jgi:hypothetical protein
MFRAAFPVAGTPGRPWGFAIFMYRHISRRAEPKPGRKAHCMLTYCVLIPGGTKMDTLPAIIVGLMIIVYGIFVYNGKLLWFLTTYKTRFKNENDTKKTYMLYGIIIIIIGTAALVIGGILLYKGIITTKDNYLY